MESEVSKRNRQTVTKWLTWGKDIDALAVVREVRTNVTEGRRGNSDSVLSSSRRIVASITVVIASSNGEMHAVVHSPVDRYIQSLRLATTKRHVRNGSLVRRLAGGSKLLLGSFHLLLSSLSGKVNASNDIAHRAAAIATENLDSNNVRALGDTVPLRSDRACAVGTVAIAVLVNVVLRKRRPPRCTPVELLVEDVDTGIDNIDVDALTTRLLVFILCERREPELGTVTDTSKTLSETGSYAMSDARHVEASHDLPMEHSSGCR